MKQIRSLYGLISGAVPTGNLVWVDAVNGVDALASRGRLTIPFRTLTAAKNAASSGDTIVVMPGTYDEKNLLKDGVNWHFLNGAVVSYSGGGSGGIFDNSATGLNTSVTSRITGWGDFIIQNLISSGGVVIASGTANLIVYGRKFSTVDTCIKCGASGGSLEINAESVDSTYTDAIQVTGTNTSTLIRAQTINTTSGAALNISGGGLDLAAYKITSSGGRAVKIGGGTATITCFEISSTADWAVEFNNVSSVAPILSIRNARIVCKLSVSTGNYKAALYNTAGSSGIRLYNCTLIAANNAALTPLAFESLVATTSLFHGQTVANYGKSANISLVDSASLLIANSSYL